MVANPDDEEAKTQPRLDEHDLAAGPLPGFESLLDRNFRGKLHQLGPGMIIDNKWELRRLLGEGAFGQVYDAWHVELDHPVAIKVLTGGHGRAEVRQRFLEEARLMAGMSSKHLVRASDYGELPDGSPYFVMELVKGKSLRHVLRERLPLPRALELGEQILERLVEVHQRGVVHGDIKPENVVVGDDDDQARLLDFGLAHTSAAAGEDVGGTPHYMAPEMLLEHMPASARTDVYAVGVVLYEMLTGRLPRGHLDMSVEQLRKTWASKPKPSPVLMYCKGVPEAQQEALAALDKLVMEALAGEPTSRPKSAQPLLDELRRLRLRLSAEALAPTLTPESTVAKSSQTEVKTTKPYGTLEARSWTVLRTVGVIAVVVLVAALVGWWSQEREGEVARTEQPAVGRADAPTREEPRQEEPPAPPKRVATLDPQALARARGGVLVAVPEGASEASTAGFTAMCKALGGEQPPVEGTMPVLCGEVPRSMADTLMQDAEDAEVRVVVLVDPGESEEIEIRSTSHHRGNIVLAKLDGLPLPNKPEAVAQVAPVLKAVVGLSTTSEATLEALPWKEVGARWGVLSEWLRLQQGQLTHEDLLRRKELARALDEAHGQDDEEVFGFYRDLAMLVLGSSACTGSEPALSESSRAGHAPAIRIAALLGRAACLADDNAGSRPGEAKALLEEAFTLSQGHRCVRVSAIGTISWIDRWNGDDVLWDAHAKQLPDVATCDPATWSQVLAVRGDTLVARKRWCDAAGAYAQAYGVLRTRVEPLLSWAEYDWRCRPSRETPRQVLLDELRAALASEAFRQPQARVSLAYLRWWLTRDVAAADQLLTAYDAVAEGEIALIDGVASDLEREICKQARPEVCSLGILTRTKQPGDAALLRQSLGVREASPPP